MQMLIGYNGSLLVRYIASVCMHVCVRGKQKGGERWSGCEVALIVCEPLHHLQAERVAPCRWLLMRARCSLWLLCVPLGASRLNVLLSQACGFCSVWVLV